MPTKASKVTYNGEDESIKGLSAAINKLVDRTRTIPVSINSDSPWNNDKGAYINAIPFEGNRPALSCERCHGVYDLQGGYISVFDSTPTIQYFETWNPNVDHETPCYYIGSFKYTKENLSYDPPMYSIPYCGFVIENVKPNSSYKIYFHDFRFSNATTEYPDIFELGDGHLLGLYFETDGYASDSEGKNLEGIWYKDEDLNIFRSRLNLPEHYTPKTLYRIDTGYSYPYGNASDGFTYGKYDQTTTGFYYPLEKVKGKADPFSVTVYSNSNGLIKFGIICEALCNPAWIELGHIVIEGLLPMDNDSRGYDYDGIIRTLEIKSDATYFPDNYISKNPGSDTYCGLEDPSANIGKDNDYYVSFNETFNKDYTVTYSSGYLWELEKRGIVPTTEGFKIYTKSEDNPNPSKIMYTVTEDEESISCLRETFIELNISGLNPNSLYSFIVDEYETKHWYTSSFPWSSESNNPFSYVFIDNVAASYREGTYVKRFTFKPANSTVKLRIPTTDMYRYISAPSSSPYITFNFEISIKKVVMDKMWYKLDGNWIVVNAGGGGGGASNLDDLNDVDITDPTNGQVLKYDSTHEIWYNADESGGGGSNVSIEPVYDSGTKIADFEIDSDKDSLFIPNNLIEITQAAYDELSELEKKDPTKLYFINDYPSGSTGVEIIPNPSGEATEKLSKLQIGDTIYSVSGGSGSGGGVEIVRFTDVNPILNPLGNFISTDTDILGMTVINDYNDNKIPYMTSNTAPSGTASASSVADSRYNEPFIAMNGIWYTSGGAVGWVPAYGDTNPYIMYTWSSPVKFSKLYLETCNWINTPDVTLTATVEGLTNEDVWENCLQTKNNLSVEFSYFRRQGAIFENLNGNSYKAVRITFNQAMNVQNTLTAVIRCIRVC